MLGSKTQPTTHTVRRNNVSDGLSLLFFLHFQQPKITQSKKIEASLKSLTRFPQNSTASRFDPKRLVRYVVSTQAAENFTFQLVQGALNWVLSMATTSVIHQPQSTPGNPLSRTEMDAARPKTRSSIRLVGTEAQRDSKICTKSDTLLGLKPR